MPDDLIARAKRFLTWRAGAYRRVFNPESVDVQVVVGDMARFCRANKSTGNPDPYLAARLDGRREVWLRIQEHMNLTTDQLYRLYGGQKNPDS